MVGGRAPLKRFWTFLRQVGRRPLARLARAYTDRGLPGRGAGAASVARRAAAQRGRGARAGRRAARAAAALTGTSAV